MSVKKHYTDIEKRLFLNILKDFAHIIETKKSDTTTLKDKQEAWREIVERYNTSNLITRRRNVQQLKKMWANQKSVQRDAITKEKQALMRTGGGPPEKTVDIDPDVAQITPHLMTMAPVLFSSDVRDEETVNNLREAVFNEELSENVESLDETITIDNSLERENVPNEQSTIQDTDQIIQNAIDNIDIIQNNRKNRRGELEELKIKRIKDIREEEQRFNRAKFEHEQLKQKLEIEFLKEKYKLVLEAIQKGNTHF